jgi:NAD(P)-dependent dehydrogenase (short-subunit alcohol dehydrogenase family)
MSANVLDAFRLDGRRAMITGAGRGLGKEMALALAQAGADVVLVGSGQDSLETAASEIRTTGRGVETIIADVADTDQCVAACETALAGGDVDILINNVGGRNVNVPIEQTSIEQWNQGIALNLTHYFIATKLVGQAMIRRARGGRVINIGSISGQIINRGVAGRHYETTKAAVIHFTRAVAADWAPYGINANAICPGLFMTDANKRWSKSDPEAIETFVAGVPMGRAGNPAEIGPLALYLASPASSYVTGASFVIDGGYTLW